MTISLTVDGTPVIVPDGSSVLDAVLASGSRVPHLCKDPDQPAIGACRTCMVEIEGLRGLRASCHTPAAAGMSVLTDSDAVQRIRRGVLQLTAAMTRPDAVSSAPDLSGELKRELERYNIDRPRAVKVRPADETSEFFVLNHAACILCARCVVACQDIQHIGAIAVAGTARHAHVGAFDEQSIHDSICTSCGQCVSVCPTGAILPKAAPEPIVREVDTVCPYCGVGCGIKLRVGESERIVSVLDAPENPSSQGMLCVKGRFGTTFVHHPDRLTRPLIRRDGKLEPATWDEALELVAGKFAEHRGSFAALASAKATNEDGYVLQKFVRLIMETNNIDHCTRLCHSPSVEAMLVQIGSGATSNSYEDYDNAGCFMVVGADPSSNHPVIASRLRRAIDEHGTRLIVVNPKRIDLCDYANIWLRPNPGTDVALFNSLAFVILDEGIEDGNFIETRTEGFAEWRASLADYAPERTEQLTGVAAARVREAARLYARPPFSGSCLLWGMGVTQHTCGTDNASALLNLALVAGQIGRPGNGISPLRGQNNVQGCGDAGCVPNSLPGYVGVSQAARAPFERVWAAELPGDQGLRATEMFAEAFGGRLRCMYVTGENPLLSEPYLAHAEEAIDRLDFLVVQEIFMSETAQRAHVVLPSTSFAEKEGTFTNSERRVQRVRQAFAPVGESRPDWAIVCEIARRVARRLGRPDAGFAFDSPAAIFDEMASLTPMLAGMSHARLDHEGGLQWPCPTSDHPGTPRLFAETFPIGKARFVPVTQGTPAAELPSQRFPYMLNTGRVLYHWHGGTMTRRVTGLLARSPELRIAVHPDDARREGIEDGADVVVISRRGELSGKALVTDAVRRGELFVPFVKLSGSAANFLTNAAYDAKSKIPEYKVCAVRIGTPDRVAEWRQGRRRAGRRASPLH